MMGFAQLDSRPLSLASYPVARAFVLSLVLHALLFVTIEFGYQAHWWPTTFLFSKRQRQIEAQQARLRAEARKQEQQEIPLVYVDVDPAQASPEPPPDAKYYSALSSKAANP